MDWILYCDARETVTVPLCLDLDPIIFISGLELVLLPTTMNEPKIEWFNLWGVLKNRVNIQFSGVMYRNNDIAVTVNRVTTVRIYTLLC